MKSWFSIFTDELKLIIQDKSILLTCLVAPILYAFFIGSIYKDKEVTQIPIAVVDMDHTSLSRKISAVPDPSSRMTQIVFCKSWGSSKYFFSARG